jgi:CheY-like chemotaxis protein
MYLNLEALRVVFGRLGLLEHCDFVSDGQQVVEASIKHVKSLDRNQDSVTIVIVDYQMPFLTGLQAVAEIKAFYNQTNFVNNRDY